MNVLRAYPLLPAAATASLVALLSLWSFVAAGLVAFCAITLASFLSLAATPRLARLSWICAALAAALAISRTLWGGPEVLFPDPLAAVRATLAAPLRRLIADPEGAIVLGIVLGERDDIPRELTIAFARSGTSHLLAISGFNMTLVAGGLAAALRGRVAPAAAAAVTVISIAAYCLLVGLGASVLRAGLMSAVACLGAALGRPAAAINALAAAVACMLVLDPQAVGEAGFLLSVGATFGLLAFQERLSVRLSRLPRLLRDNLAATLAASLPTIPIVVGIFGQASLIAPLANVLAVPLFAPLMVAGMATSVLGVLSEDLARVAALVAYGLAFALRAIVERASAVPLAALQIPDGFLAGAVAAIATAALVFTAFTLGRWRRGVVVIDAIEAARGEPASVVVWRRVRAVVCHVDRRSALACGAVVLLVVASASFALVSRGPALRIRALDVGQGDAFLIESSGRYVLIDGGPDPARLLTQLGASLPPWHRRLDVVALTHAHLDHGAGLIALFERYEIGLALEPEGLNDVPLSASWSAAAARAGVPRRALSSGARVQVGAASLTALSPNGNPRVDVPSLVLRLDHGAFSMLFPGDATDDALADLLLVPSALAVTVYVPPHHGATTPHASELVAATRPKAAVLSVGARNRYGHPTPDTLRALGAIPAYRTDRDGTVEIEVDGGEFSIRTHANGLSAARGRSVPFAPATR